MNFENTLSFAQELDNKDPLKKFRQQFYIPEINGCEAIYFCGNSLGLQPKTVKQKMEQELNDWAELGVEGHFQAKNPWLTYHQPFCEPLARLVGAQLQEVVAMNNLTVNLHLMMVSFYRPTATRYKIVIEGGAFPSDQYAVESQARFHGFDPDQTIMELLPREGEYTLRTEDILETISRHGSEIALIMLGGVNYYTGQLYNMKAIAEAGHKAGAIVGFDLAHAIGNVPIELHNWNVDFAVWCSYKYLNSGPGGVSGAFIHEQHNKNTSLPRFAGWWGYEEKTRFQMKKGFIPEKGAAGWQLSNVPVFNMVAHKASLEIFDEVGMQALRAKSEQLTGYMEFMIREANKAVGHEKYTIITPKNKEDRGCQLSVICKENGRAVFDKLMQSGIIGDWREPEVLRFAPVPLYNTFEDVNRFGKALASAH